MNNTGTGTGTDTNMQGRRRFLKGAVSGVAAGAALSLTEAAVTPGPAFSQSGATGDEGIGGTPEIGWVAAAATTSDGGEPTWASPSSLVFTGGLTITEPVNSGTLQDEHELTLVPRNNTALGYPVPVFRPATANVPLALDIQPNGTGLNANNGYCWLDACDGDTTGNPALSDAGHAVNTARLAAQSDHTSVGGASVGGATPKPFWIRVPTNGNGGTTPLIKLAAATGGVASANGYTLASDPFVILNAAGGSVVASSGYQLATGSPCGFLYIPQVAAGPTGMPHSYGASNPICYVKGQRQLKVYDASLAEWITFTGT
jgi:hypothetical protein